MRTFVSPISYWINCRVEMRQIICTIVLLSITLLSSAQGIKYKQGLKVPCPVCYASGKTEKARIPPPNEFLLKSGKSVTSEIVVDYIGFTDEAKTAFQYAVDIWESLIESEVPIRMRAVWSGKLDDNVLGSCGPETYYSNFKDAPFEDRFYPVALAEKIAKEELNGESRYDMNANFNKNIGWYLGTDMVCPDTLYDFVSVVLHEIGHGLGFTGFFFVDENLGSYGYYNMGDATSFDVLVQNSNKEQLVDTSFFANASEALKLQLTSPLFANSPVGKKRNRDFLPKLYAPVEFDGGSSVYHLNDASFPHGSINSLMTHAVGRGEAIHNPGPVTLGIMDDIGWKNIFIHYNPPKDAETVQPINFDIEIESDYEIDTEALYVIYSNDGFQSHSDSIDLVATGEANRFTASINPGNEVTEITYYLEVADEMGRIKRSPAVAPKKYNTVKFGADNEAPVIDHEAIPFLLLLGDPLDITVNASDNLGIDTVFVAYSLNGVEQTAFGLAKTDYNVYQGDFSIDVENVKDGDVIEYVIHAKDASTAQNSTQLPAGDERFSFKVEEIFEPVNTYSNNFNVENADFLLSDFRVFKARGFEDAALHSPHPYASPGIDNHEFNFWTFLKKPVILSEGLQLSFDEVVLVEPGTERLEGPDSEYGDEDFWDYVIVEASDDHGKNWWALADGYDSGNKALWKESFNANIVNQQDSRTEGTPDMFFKRKINLLESGHFAIGDTVLIRFRLYSDPYANGWGWAIDNLAIEQATSAGNKLTTTSEIKIYPNPFRQSVKIFMLSDKPIDDLHISVYDIFGKKVFEKQTQNVIGIFEENLDLRDMTIGMYLVQVKENGRAVYTKKLIKN